MHLVRDLILYNVQIVENHKIHMRVFLYALLFGMIAYGVVQIGISLHRFFAF